MCSYDDMNVLPLPQMVRTTALKTKEINNFYNFNSPTKILKKCSIFVKNNLGK